ncbi:sister chromatid cohesion 1 protein 2 isoform X1 [Phoenix dactylifera]|uniref:Sister chromatid cohesion 1 protein 2 isoform X1 n=1 Tax=Phoenix dactylifera TaxID=42345 RepID=A0A8B7CVY8_PHODC|nr:sister chromatid cohesion 1 protein 2 isoform X1 [Phoenix dactylifera]
MFYSQSLLSRKGPLGNIWIAAFCFKKLKKDQIADTDISSSVDKIMPEVHISYRILAQLLLGIVRIFSKKVDYLYHDCNEALTNIRKSFMPSQRIVQNEAIAKPRHNVMQTKKVIHVPDQRVNIAKEATSTAPIEAMRASYNHVTITVPERFELDSFDLDISDECETAKSHEQTIAQDDWTDERDQTFFLNEQYHRETVIHAEFDSACFTPVDDVLPSHMMDIDFTISQIYNLNSMGVRGGKTRGHSQHIEESGSFAGLAAMESLGPNVHNVESDHQVHPLKLQEMTPSDPDKNIHAKELQKPVEPIMLHQILSSNHEKTQILVGGDSKATSPSKTHDRTYLPCDLGLASPKFTVRTPAKRERPPMLRKRKKLFDETIVLSNEALRQGIHDASSLIFKRRKAPHTYLDAWKADIIANLQQTFMDPLVPCTSSELKALFQNKSSDYLSSQKTLAEYHTEAGNAQNGIPNKSADNEETCQERIIETPATEVFADEPRTSKSSEMETNKPSSLETSDTELDLMDKELGSHEESSIGQGIAIWVVKAIRFSLLVCHISFCFYLAKGNTSLNLLYFILTLCFYLAKGNSSLNLLYIILTLSMFVADNRWSVRTRAAAQYLCSKLLDIKNREQKGFLSLARILEGKTRRKCARFFYETLILKGRGLIDVKQDCAYGDIIISAGPQLEAEFNNP